MTDDGLMLNLHSHGAYGLIVAVVRPEVRDALWFPFTRSFIESCGETLMRTRSEVEEYTGVLWWEET